MHGIDNVAPVYEEPNEEATVHSYPSHTAQQVQVITPRQLWSGTRAGCLMDIMDQRKMATVSGETGDKVSSEYQTLDRATMEWEVAPHKVSIIKVIGKGAFGQVAKATAVDIRGMPGESVVAVKMLKGLWSNHSHVF